MTRWIRSSTGRLALLGLLVLLIVDVGLVALAFRHDPVGSGPATQAQTPVPAPQSTPVASTPTVAPGPEAHPVPLQQVVVGLDASRAWRAVLGTCDKGGASIEVTGDGGRTWQARKAPAKALGRVQPVSADRAFVIGADASCSAGEYITADGAGTWDGPRELQGAWSRTPGGASSTAVTPDRAGARPCGSGTLLDLARVSGTSARALCADGSVTTSTDGGATWTGLAKVTGALALSVRDEKGTSRVYVARVGQGCAGVEVARVSEGSSTQVACVPVPDALPEGQVSLSAVGKAGWLSVGDATYRAGADLRTWTAAG